MTAIKGAKHFLTSPLDGRYEINGKVVKTCGVYKLLTGSGSLYVIALL